MDVAVAVVVTKSRRSGVSGGAGHHFDDGAVAARADGGTGRRVGWPWVGIGANLAIRFAGRNSIVAVSSAATVAGRGRADRFGVSWAWRTFGAVTGVIRAGPRSPITIRPVAVIFLRRKRGHRAGHGFDYVGTAVAATANGVQRTVVVAVHAAVGGSRAGRWTTDERRRAWVERVQGRSLSLETATGGKAAGPIGACWWVVAMRRVP